MDGSGSFIKERVPGAVHLFLSVLCSAILATAQTPNPSDDPVAALRVQVEQFRLTLAEMNDQLAHARSESQNLRQELETLRGQLNEVRNQPGRLHSEAQPPAPKTRLDEQVATLGEDQQLLSAKVDDQHQTKVESGSKYRLRLSGMALLNVFSTHGAVDNLDFPKIAISRAAGDPNGSFAATVRQSLISLDVAGPRWAGASISGDVAFDFFGGFPSNPEGVTQGQGRLRTARISLEWANTSIVAGQDVPFFSPLSPTSVASTAYPALSSSGNLWAWTPQVRVEQRLALSDFTKVILQGGILDPLTGELPAEYNRMPTAGEASRIPAYAMRIALQYNTHEHLAAMGAGAYYSRQAWGFGRNIDSWATTMDGEAPLGRWFKLTGEAYRGRAIGGLGGGVQGSVLFTGLQSLASSALFPLESAGGWSQLKFKPLEQIEFNAAIGQDYSFLSRARRLSIGPALGGVPVSRNQSAFFNVIFQPRSILLFSFEYRHLSTSFSGPRQTAGYLSVSSGIVF